MPILGKETVLTSREPELGGESASAWSGYEPHLSEDVAIMEQTELLRKWRTRSEATRSLLRMGPSAIPALIRTLYDPNPGTRIQTTYVLGQIAPGSVHQRLAVDALLVALSDGHMMVRQGACLALGNIADTHALDGLIRASFDFEPWVRRDAILALGMIGKTHPGFLSHIVPVFLRSAPDLHHIRSTARNVLVEIGEPAIPALLNGLYKDGWAARRLAGDALVRIGKASLPALQEALSTPDIRARRMVKWAIERIA